MKKSIITVAAILTLSVGVNGISFAAIPSKSEKPVQRYAVVDVKKVVNSSKNVKELKAEREKQKEQVLNFVKESNAKVDAEKDSTKKEELKKKLNNDLKYMTNTFDKKYKEDLKKINDDISSDISKIGKVKNYDLILTTDAVLYGGQNITNELIKVVK